MSKLLKPGQFSIAELRRLGYSPSPKPRTASGPVEEVQDLPLAGMESLRDEALHQGYQEGFQTGYRDGIAEAEAKIAEAQGMLEDAQAKAKSIVARAQAEAAAFLQEVRPEVLDLAVEIARRIMRREVSQCPEALLSMAEAAMEKVKAEEAVVVRVNPRDVVVVSEGKARLLEGVTGIKSLHILEDDTVEPGGCIVEGNRGRVDATLESQLAMVREALLEAGHDG
ncbi:MAG: FliH/SctL family protein [Bacillota bacterium]